ncbi:hypothetical protein [Pseudomonas protegens]|uniref:hypothetical protein n=1 Tax=Pseudomonas protegens TaxID=380021 RepID=UPI002777B121|nr:hypothetical protein [Pseudomonas protegens]MDP9514747.1 hypothetical protein [Pseudomonas protegens]
MDMNNLLSGFLGGFLGVIATLIVARFQLKQVTKHHLEAMGNNERVLQQQVQLSKDAHANQLILLKETYNNQLRLIAAEHRIASEVTAIKRIQSLLNDDIQRNYQIGRDVYHESINMLLNGNSVQFNIKLVEFRDQASTAYGKINTVIQDNNQHWESLSRIEATRSMINSKWESIQILHNKLSELRSPLNEETIGLVTHELRAFEDFLNTYSNWTSKCKEACATRLKELMA